MIKLIIRSIPLSVIPNGVNFEIFKPQRFNRINKKLGLDIDDFIVLF